MNEKIINFLSRIHTDMPREDIEDSLQDAALSVVETGNVDKYNTSYQVKRANFRIRQLRRDRREYEPLLLGDLSHKEDDFSYDPTPETDVSLDVTRILTRNFTAKEIEIILAYFAEGVSTHQLAREYGKYQMHWHRWLEGKVRPLLKATLAEYAEIFNGSIAQKEAV